MLWLKLARIVWVNAIAWGLLLASNLVQLALALYDHEPPQLTALFLVAGPLFALLLPLGLAIRYTKRKGAFWAAWLLVVWIPCAMYCIQFWSPDHGG